MDKKVNFSGVLICILIFIIIILLIIIFSNSYKVNDNFKDGNFILNSTTTSSSGVSINFLDYSNDTLNLISFDDLLLTKALILQDEKEDYLKSINKNKYYLFRYLFLGKKYDSFSEDELNFLACIENDSIKDEISKKIKDNFLKNICIGINNSALDENPLDIKNNIIITKKSVGLKEKNYCDSIINQGNQNIEYFICYGLAYNDFERTKELINLYSRSLVNNNCGLLKTNNSYLFESCNEYVGK